MNKDITEKDLLGKLLITKRQIWLYRYHEKEKKFSTFGTLRSQNVVVPINTAKNVFQHKNCKFEYEKTYQEYFDFKFNFVLYVLKHKQIFVLDKQDLKNFINTFELLS